MELRQEIRFDSVTRLVPWPQIIPKGLNYVVGRDRNVRRAALHRVENRPQYATHCGYFASILVPSRRQCIVMPEQLVGAVDQVNLQMRLQDHCTELKPT